ncbi:hypothetical protein ACLOJK_032338 [Asimina triloba]
MLMLQNLPWCQLPWKELLQNLYNANVRKVVIMGLAPLGCNPHYLWEYNSKGGLCVSEINDMVIAFNFAMREMVDELHRELPDAKITFCDVFEGAMDILQNCQHYGFETITDACRGLGQYGGLIMCISPEMACANASKHVWWDQFHPTGAVNAIIADSVWSGLHANICYPMILQDMGIPWWANQQCAYFQLKSSEPDANFINEACNPLREDGLLTRN